MTISHIENADDLAALATEAVKQVREHKQYRDLIAAILMANHVADWHFRKQLGHKDLSETDKKEMRATYPEWDVLRKLANGTKHCKLQARQSSVEWEQSDFWGSPAHVGNDGLDWFVEFDGQERSVIILIESFLEKFADHSLRPI